MEVAAFVMSCVALTFSAFALGWRVWTWWYERRFKVRVRLASEMVVVGSGKYDVTVVVENLGGTHEAVQDISLLYAEHAHEHAESGMVIGPPSVLWHVPKGEGDLPPRRNVRKTFDLLGSRFLPFLPTAVEAHVLLESGKRLTSEEPYRTSAEGFRVAGPPHGEQPGELPPAPPSP